MRQPIAFDSRDELYEDLSHLSFKERLERVFQLGELKLEAFQKEHGVDRETAIRELQRQRQAGRTPSKCMSDLIG